jgi:hypothetical protein
LILGLHASIIYLVKLITRNDAIWSDEFDTPPFFGKEIGPDQLGHWLPCKELNLNSEIFGKVAVLC